MSSRERSESVPASPHNHRGFQVPTEHPQFRQSVQPQPLSPEVQAVLQAALAQQQQQFQRQLQELSQHYQQQQIDQQPPQPEPKVRLPDPFDGSRCALRGFINQILMVISRKPRTYATDSDKVMLVADLLKGNALLWFSPLFERQDPILQDFPGFVQALRARFDDPNKSTTAARRLEILRQGRRPVATYASEFQLLVEDADWDGAAAQHQFRKGLNEEVKDLLLTCPEAPDLNGLIATAIRCGDRLFEREQERRGRVSSNPHRHSNGPVHDPMCIDSVRSTARPRLDETERARRRDTGSCMYCGDADHPIDDCPALAQRNRRLSGNARG